MTPVEHVPVASSHALLILRALKTRNGPCCHQDFEAAHCWRAPAPKRFRWVQCGARECRVDHWPAPFHWRQGTPAMSKDQTMSGWPGCWIVAV